VVELPVKTADGLVQVTVCELPTVILGSEMLELTDIPAELVQPFAGFVTVNV